MPALACQFVTAVIASALRGQRGVVRPTVIIQVLAVLANHGPRAAADRWMGAASRAWGVAGRRPCDLACRRYETWVMLWAYFRRSARTIAVDWKQLHPRH